MVDVHHLDKSPFSSFSLSMEYTQGSPSQNRTPTPRQCFVRLQTPSYRNNQPFAT